MSAVEPPVTVAVNGALPPIQTGLEVGEIVPTASGLTITLITLDAGSAQSGSGSVMVIL